MAFEEVGVRAIVKGMSQYMSDIDSIERKTSGLGSKLTGIGQGLIGAGAKLTAGLTVPLIGAGAAVIKFGLDFEKQMTNIATLTNIPKEYIGELRESIFEISKATAKSPEELGAAAYFVLSAGFSDAADAANILTIAAKQSALGMGSTETTVRTLAGLLQAYGAGSQEEAATSLNALFTQLISPSDKLKEVLGAMGFTVEGLLAGLKTDAIGTLTNL